MRVIGNSPLVALHKDATSAKDLNNKLVIIKSRGQKHSSLNIMKL
jgi:hypothetical protein